MFFKYIYLEKLAPEELDPVPFFRVVPNGTKYLYYELPEL